MASFGWALSSEEHPAQRLAEIAERAERAGFDFAMVSDHFHPWIDRQGNSPFVWATLGAISQRTERIRIGTGVTCPTIRIHPAIIAQAAATAATLLPGRFWLGVGSGEALNEHILGDRWPANAVRLEMLEEAIEVIRGLWDGRLFSHHGRHYTVETARIYSLPDEPPPILVASAGRKANELAARAGDGLIGLAPKAEMIEQFEAAGADPGAPKVGQVHVCWAASEEEGRRTALEWWPNSGVPGKLFIELPLPEHFEQAAEIISEEMIGESVICGADPERHVEAIREFLDAGYDHVYVHQIGPDQDEAISFYEREVLPELG